MEPVLAALERDGVPVQDIDVVAHPDLARRFQLQAIPTLILLQEGQEVRRVVGATSLEKLREQLPFPSQPARTEREEGVAVRGQSPEFSSPRELNAPPSAPAAFAATRSAPAERAVLPRTPEPVGRETSVAEKALAATVRLKVDDAKGHSLGTGTIVAQSGSTALIVTCGHIFRESKGQGKVTVDLFHPVPQRVIGTVVGFDDYRDIGLVQIDSQQQLQALPVAPGDYAVAPGDRVVSVGCNAGDDPTVAASQVKSVNRYQGPPNIEVAGAPVDGRSGGGLFSADGYLIGVCNAADAEDNEGIFASHATIHWQLNAAGASELAAQTLRRRENVSESPNTLAAVTTPSPSPFAEREAPLPSMPVYPASFQGAPLSSDSAEDTEVICIVRSKSHPERKNQIYVLDRVTRDFLAQVASSHPQPPLAADVRLQAADRRQSASAQVAPPENGSPVVRGQSFDVPAPAAASLFNGR
jgi:S1-C subfamily serine protease